MGLHQAGELGANAKYACHVNICDAVCGSWLPGDEPRGCKEFPGVTQGSCSKESSGCSVKGMRVSGKFTGLNGDNQWVLSLQKASVLLSSASWVIFCAQSQCKHNFSPQSPEEGDGTQRGEIRQGVVRDTDLAATSNVRNADSFWRENRILPNFSGICLWSLVWETLA